VSAEAPLTDFFVAVDNLETFTTGTFAGLPNPNFGRLTLLVAHRSPDEPEDSHFHAIGAVSYASLEGGGQKIIETSTNNRIPEIHTGQLPLQLLSRSLLDQRAKGNAFFLSHPTETEYSHLKIESIQVLQDFDPTSAEGLLFHSSGGRWTAPLDGAIVALQPISVTPGLHIAMKRARKFRLRVSMNWAKAIRSVSFRPIRRNAQPTWALTLPPSSSSTRAQPAHRSKSRDALRLIFGLRAPAISMAIAMLMTATSLS
jgi:hypothetical protein